MLNGNDFTIIKNNLFVFWFVLAWNVDWFWKKV